MDRISTYSFYLFVSLLLLFPFTAEAQQKAYPFVQNFEPEQYGAHSQTWSITQTQGGHILVGTGNGIVIFDGQEFSFPSGSPLMVSTLITTSDGSIFYGADNRFGQLIDGPDGYPQYFNHTEKMDSELQNFGAVRNLKEQDNYLLIPSRDRLFLYSGEHYEVINPLENSFHKAHTLNERVYIGEINTGLFTLNEDNELDLAAGGELFLDDKMPYFMLPFDEYRAVIGTVKSGLFWYYTKQMGNTHQGSLEPFPNEVNDILKSTSISNGIKLQNGNYAIGTSTAGVVIINQKGELVQKIDKRAGLQSDIVNNLYEDRQGNLWMALNHGFSMAEIGSPISHYNEDSGLEGAVLIAKGLNNQLYVGTAMGLYQQDGYGFRRNDDISSTTWDLDTYQGSNKDKILVANNFGLYMVDEEITTQLSSNHSSSVLQSGLNPERIYAGTPNGLYYVEKRGDQFFEGDEFLNIGNPVRQLLEGDDGGIWVATQSDGIRYVTPDLNPDNITVYRSNEDYFVEHNATLHRIDGELFVSTITNFYQYDPETDSFTEWRNPALEDNELDGIYRFFHKNGTVWAGAGATSERSDLTEYRSFFSDSPERIESPFRSMPSSVTLFIDEIFGDIWVGNPQGLFQYSLDESSKSAEFEPPQIRRIDIITDTTITVNPLTEKGLELPFDNSRFRFTVAAPWFNVDHSTEFRYRIEPFDQQWSDWTDNHIVEYTSLREGDYSFTVQARNRDGNISDAATYSFSITPPWYRSPWAYLMYVFMFIGLVYSSGKFINVYKTRKLEKFNRKLERQVKKRSLEIRRQNKQLKEMNKEKNEFMNIAVHDLRNPLSGIQGLADLLATIDDDSSTEEVRTLGSIIHDSSLRMFELIDKYLDVHKIEQGQITAKLETLSLDKVTQATVSRFEKHLTKKNLSLDIQSAKNETFVMADSELIAQVLNNLISNAIKYSYEGSSIIITLHKDKSSGGVTIKDQGAGISKENQKKLYRKFSQIGTKPTGGEVSIGLGLSIVKKLMEMMKGDIHCKSELGKGAAFTISLPISKKIKEPQV